MKLMRPFRRLMTLTDARGHPVSVRAPLRARDERHGAARQVGTVIVDVLIFGQFLLFLIAGAVAALTVLGPGSEDDYLAAGMVFAAFAAPAGLFPIMWLWGVRHAGVYVARLLLRAHICCRCGYELTGLRPEADGCTVCPECEAAWRLAGVPRRLSAPMPVEDAPPGAFAAGLRNRVRRGFTLTDDRGLRWLIWRPGNILQERLPRRQRLIRLAQLLGLLVVSWTVLTVLLVLVFLLLGIISMYELGESGPGPAPMLLAAAMMFIFVLNLTRRRVRSDISVLLAQSVCPICGDPLDAAATGTDACVECIACGSAWRSEMLGTDREP